MQFPLGAGAGPGHRPSDARTPGGPRVCTYASQVNAWNVAWPSVMRMFTSGLAAPEPTEPL